MQIDVLPICGWGQPIAAAADSTREQTHRHSARMEKGRPAQAAPDVPDNTVRYQRSRIVICVRRENPACCVMVPNALLPNRLSPPPTNFGVSVMLSISNRICAFRPPTTVVFFA